MEIRIKVSKPIAVAVLAFGLSTGFKAYDDLFEYSKNLEIFFLPKTGDELITEIIIENQIFDVTLISGKIVCNGKVAAQCEMKIFINQLKNQQS